MNNETAKKSTAATIPSILPGGWFLGSGEINVSQQLTERLRNYVDDYFYEKTNE